MSRGASSPSRSSFALRVFTLLAQFQAPKSPFELCVLPKSLLYTQSSSLTIALVTTAHSRSHEHSSVLQSSAARFRQALFSCPEPLCSLVPSTPDTPSPRWDAETWCYEIICICITPLRLQSYTRVNKPRDNVIIYTYTRRVYWYTASQAMKPLIAVVIRD